jgi:hypothetical protein
MWLPVQTGMTALWIASDNHEAALPSASALSSLYGRALANLRSFRIQR